MDSTIDSTTDGSCFDNAVLMSSSDTLSNFSFSTSSERLSLNSNNISELAPMSIPELMLTSPDNITQILSHSSDKTINNGACDTLTEFTRNSIKGSSIWPFLTLMEKSFNESNEPSGKENTEIIECLGKEYEIDPNTFMDHLLTIIEESFDDYSEASNVSSVADFSKAPSISILSDESTKYTSYQKLIKKTPQKLNITYKKTPGKITNGKNFESNATNCTQQLLTSPDDDDDDESTHTTPNTRQSRTYTKTPKIIVISGTPESLVIRHRVDRLSPRSSNNDDDDDDYLTAESESESQQDTIMNEASCSKCETMNMSKVARNHEEWVSTYEKISKYKLDENDFTTRILERKERTGNYANKLEKRLFRELTKKREKCLNSVNLLLDNAAIKSRESEGERSPVCLRCDECKRKIQFYNTLMACSDYFNFATEARESLTSTGNEKTITPRSISRSPLKSRNKNDKVSRSSTRRSRSIGKKITRIKSPGARYSVNQRRSIGRTSVGTKKTSSRSNKRKNEKSNTPVIDKSSIKPVSQLRKIFSPRPNIPESRIPLPSNHRSKMYVSTMTMQTMLSSSGTPISTITKQKYKHVKSPVYEYIRGKNIMPKS